MICAQQRDGEDRLLKHMKTAFSSWNNRIAPVFDVARQVFLVESDAGRIIHNAEEELPPDEVGAKARRLAGLGVNTLVCGAISRIMQGLVASYGITVIPFVAGDLQDVIQAWLEGRLDDELFTMPGCCPRGSRRRGYINGFEKEDSGMRGRGRGGRGVGLRSGQDRCGPGGGSGSAIFSTGSGSLCVCPQCSHREPHERGMPCSQKQCPICGSALIRG
jgi:predicted Fe-Mo cluster-binding NifX family protein